MANIGEPEAAPREQKKPVKKEGMRAAAPLLDRGEMIRFRYSVDSLIGGGGFGQIFRVMDTTRKESMALKIEPSHADVRRMKLEHMIMLSHIPVMYGSGRVRECPFIVMQLLGKNLSELRRLNAKRRLSFGTVFRVGQQVIAGLRHMHEAGYIHRDVKPSNCCIGRGERYDRIVYVVDFGMARRFVDSNGNIRPARRYAPFRGTVRYVSMTVHRRMESGPGDDLVGWMYSMIELAEGSLPWTPLLGMREVEHCKRETSLETLCRRMPPPFIEYCRMVTQLKMQQQPDYETIYSILKKCLPDGVTDETLYDWEVGNKNESQKPDSGQNRRQPQKAEETPKRIKLKRTPAAPLRPPHADIEETQRSSRRSRRA